jgi:hypothetical protein
MAGNFERIEVEIDDHGLSARLLTRAEEMAPLGESVVERVAEELRRTATLMAPRRGDARRGWTGNAGNLAYAVHVSETNTALGTNIGEIFDMDFHVEDRSEASVKIDQELAPYARWVLGGSGPKTAKYGLGKMSFPETRSGFFPKIWRLGYVRGNPKQDFLAWALEAKAQYIRDSADNFGRNVADI